MFNDRLEISNPGGLYGSLTVEDLNNVVNPPVRNENLVRILEEMEEIENKYSGIATMVNSIRDLKLEPPVFENKRENFTVTFKNHNLMTKEDREWLKDLQVSLTENENKVINYLIEKQHINNLEARNLLNLSPSGARKVLKEMADKKIIEP
jgi:ATP-dependent DNA helicase RecG